MSCVGVPLPVLFAVHYSVPSCVVCMAEVCGQECAGIGTCFMRFGSVCACIRTGTVTFRVVSVRYCARLV